MKRNFRLVLAPVLIIMMLVVSIAGAAFAAPADSAANYTNYGDSATSHTVTINNEDQLVSHTYAMYQIFSGNLNDNEDTLSDIAWGDGIDTTTSKGTPAKTLIKALADSNLLTGITISSTASDVAKAIADSLVSTNGVNQNAGNLDKIAKIFDTYKTGTPVSFTESNKKYTSNSAVRDGYYLIVETTGSAALTQQVGTETFADTRSRFLLQIVTNVEINAKDSGTQSDKNIVEGEEKLNDNDAAIGDVITYTAVLDPIPDPIKFDWFVLNMADTMEKGLTFLGVDSVEIKNTNGTTAKTVTANEYSVKTKAHSAAITTYNALTANGNAYYVAADAANITTDEARVKYADTNAPTEATDIKIIFTNAKALIEGTRTVTDSATSDPAEYAGKTLVVTYKAMLNKNAEIAPQSNDNTMHFEFSNNPNYDYDGEPTDTDELIDEVKGKTTDKTVETYTTDLILYKVDEDGNKLSGAEFTVTAGDTFTLTKVTGEKFEQQANGGYWLLKDGSYTNRNPATITDSATKAQYASPDTQYALVPVNEEIKVPDSGSSNRVYTIITDSNGIAHLTGIKAGNYTVEETHSPDGYNKINGTTTITVSWNTVHDSAWASPEDATKETKYGGFTFTTDEGVEGIAFAWDASDSAGYKIYSSIVNRSGATLPSTGGIGTTIFYIAGSIMVLAAAILLVTKRRMGAND